MEQCDFQGAMTVLGACACSQTRKSERSTTLTTTSRLRIRLALPDVDRDRMISIIEVCLKSKHTFQGLVGDIPGV